MNSSLLLADAKFFDVVGNLIWNLSYNVMEEAINGFGKYALKFLVRKLSDDPDLTIISKENKQTKQTKSLISA